MKTFLLVSQLVISGLLILSILSQEKGAGLSATFGGTGQLYRGRRGVDRLLLWITVILAVLFVSLSLASLILVPGSAASPSPEETSSSAPFSVTAEGENASGITVTPVPIDSESESSQ